MQDGQSTLQELLQTLLFNDHVATHITDFSYRLNTLQYERQNPLQEWRNQKLLSDIHHQEPYYVKKKEKLIAKVVMGEKAKLCLSTTRRRIGEQSYSSILS
jgi:hypothetical protein